MGRKRGRVMKYINADLIKELMKRSIALQGNCEYTLWLQSVDNYVDNLPSIDVDCRGRETTSDKIWCSKCRYFYRDFTYGLACYRLMDDKPCQFEEYKEGE